MLVTIRCRMFHFTVCYSKNTKFNLYDIAISPVLLYGCKTWCCRFRNEHRLRVFENRVLRKIFGPKNHEVTGDRRRPRNEQLCDLYFIQYIIRVIK